MYLACICWTLDSFSRAFLRRRVEFSVYSGFQNCYFLLCYRVFSFQWSVIVNLLLRVSQGVKTAREKHELHTAIEAGKCLNHMEMIRCLKISGLRNTLPFESLQICSDETQKQPGPVFTSETKFRKTSCLKYPVKRTCKLFFPPPSSQWDQLSLAPRILILLPTPTFSPPTKLCPGNRDSYLHTNGLHTCQHFSAPILKKAVKAAKWSLSVSTRKDSIHADLFDQFRSRYTRSTGVEMTGKY